MIESSGLTWPVILAFANLLLSSAIVITAFSLLGFMLTRNLRSAVAQTFSVLLACVLIVFAIDIIVPRVESVARGRTSGCACSGSASRWCRRPICTSPMRCCARPGTGRCVAGPW